MTTSSGRTGPACVAFIPKLLALSNRGTYGVSVGSMNSTLNFIDGHQISYAVAGACALFLFLLLLFELLRTRLYFRRRASAAARTTTTDPRAQTLALRPRLGLVLRGLAGLEERPERHVVLPPRLTALLAPGPRRLARVDDGRAGLHLLVLSVGED